MLRFARKSYFSKSILTSSLEKLQVFELRQKRFKSTLHTNEESFSGAAKLEQESALSLFWRRLCKSVRIFKKQLDQGITTPAAGFFYFGTMGVFAYYCFEKYTKPYRDQAKLMPLRLRTPLSDTHNALFGLAPSVPEGSDPASMAALDFDLERPALIATERSEAFNAKVNEDGIVVPPAPGEPRTDVIVLQLQDFDVKKQMDVFFRSIHYLTSNAPDPEKKTVKSQRNPIFEHKEEATPIGGTPDNRLHGVVKCKGISATNNCVIDVNHVESEAIRKMLLALGPMWLLKDPTVNYFPNKWLQDSEYKQQVCICGIGGGILPMLIHYSYPHMKLDVCEKDATLLRLARKFLGFREMTDLRVFLDDPTEYFRRNVIAFPQKYDAIFLDCFHDEKGKPPIEYARLEFLTAVRNSLNRRGVVVANLPNHDDRIFQSMIGNWRMAFDGKTIVLIHCSTSPNTILMTFQDEGSSVESKFGHCADSDEFKDLLRAHIYHFRERLTFDILKEVNNTNFQQMLPGKNYSFKRRTAPEAGARDVTYEKEMSRREAAGEAPGQTIEPLPMYTAKGKLIDSAVALQNPTPKAPTQPQVTPAYPLNPAQRWQQNLGLENWGNDLANQKIEQPKGADLSKWTNPSGVGWREGGYSSHSDKWIYGTGGENRPEDVAKWKAKHPDGKL